MKKRNVMTALLVLIVMLFSVLLTSCNATDPERIDDYYEKLIEEESMTVDMSIDLGVLGSYSMQMKIDGNKTYTGAFMGEEPYFTETVNGKAYTYTKEGTSWVKSDGEAVTDDETAVQALKELFNGKNYEYDEEQELFVIKDNAVVSYEDMVLSGGTLKFEGDACVIRSSATLEGMTVTIQISIKDVGETKITLPNVG